MILNTARVAAVKMSGREFVNTAGNAILEIIW